MALGSGRTTALVTGAAGFVGSHLTDRLLGEGYEVVGIDSLMTGDLSNLEGAARSPHFHFQVGDVREPLHVYADVVFNLACPASPAHYQSDPYATTTTCVLGAMRVMEIARGRRCKVVHASTSEVYGDPEVHPQRESYWGNVNPIGPRACYDEGKRVAETLLFDASTKEGIDVRVARIFNTYGPRMALRDGRVVTNFVVQAIEGRPVTVHGDGSQTRSLCFVSDLVEGLFEMSVAKSVAGPLNLGNPREIEIVDLAKMVVEMTSSASRIVHCPAAKDDPKRRCPDVGKAREVLGFDPQVCLEEGLSETIRDVRRRLNRELS